MGQYYHPIILQDGWEEGYKAYMNKSAEPSLQIAEETIMGTLYSHDFGNGLKLMEHSYIGNSFVQAVMRMIDKFDEYKDGVHFVWCGDYSDYEDLYTLAGIMRDDEQTTKKMNDMVKDAGRFDYVAAVNHTKKEFVVFPEFEQDKWTIHPLPILTSSGNGRGLGDYHTTKDCNTEEEKPNAKFVGTWAFDYISVLTDSKDIPTDYKKIEWETEFEE